MQMMACDTRDMRRWALRLSQTPKFHDSRRRQDQQVDRQSIYHIHHRVSSRNPSISVHVVFICYATSPFANVDWRVCSPYVSLPTAISYNLSWTLVLSSFSSVFHSRVFHRPINNLFYTIRTYLSLVSSLPSFFFILYLQRDMDLKY